MKQRSAWLLFLPLLFVGSCATRSIHGQVFVVTEGGTSVKLGSVRILLFPEERMLAHVADRDHWYEAALSRARDENAELARVVAESDAISDSLEALRMARLRAELKQTETDEERSRERARIARRDAQDAVGKYADAHERRMAAATSDQIMRGDVDPVEERRRMEVLAEEADQAEAREGSLLQRIATLKTQLSGAGARSRFQPLPIPHKTSAMYFEDLPLPRMAAETDADGRFTLRLPSTGKWVIAAHGERKLSGRVEDYYWMVRVSTGGEGDLLLSNSCTTRSGSTLSIVRVGRDH